MKYNYIILLVNFIFGSFLYAQHINEAEYERTNTMLNIRLPYHINSGINRVFHENTVLAINIIEIRVDEEQIFPEFNVIDYMHTFSIKRKWINRNLNLYYMKMQWTHTYYNNSNHFLWCDGRSYDTYIIREGSQRLFIRYRIIYPFCFPTVEKLRTNNIPRHAYSDEYSVIIDLTGMWR